jgi:hypothetical protein
MQGLDMLSDYDYIAIFDADFKPEPDFLVSALCSSCSSMPARASCDSLMCLCPLHACMHLAAPQRTAGVHGACEDRPQLTSS